MIQLALLLIVLAGSAEAQFNCTYQPAASGFSVACTPAGPQNCTPPQPDNVVTACPAGQVGGITTSYACVGTAWTPTVVNTCTAAPPTGLVCPTGLNPQEGAFGFIGNTVPVIMPSGRVASFPLLPVNYHTGGVNLVEGSSVPGGPLTTELQVSRCKGDMSLNPNNPACYARSVNSSFSKLNFAAKPFGPIVDEKSAQTYGHCWAPEGGQFPYFVNVRYTYTNCQYGTCGFVIQQGNGAY